LQGFSETESLSGALQRPFFAFLLRKWGKMKVLAAISLTPRFSGVWASGAASEPLQRFASAHETAEAVASFVPLPHPAKAGC
jgi:hypothetical protein